MKLSTLALLIMTTGCASGGIQRTVMRRDTLSPAVAEIRAMRAASNAAIARRDVAGSLAAMLPGYRGTWAQSTAHRSVDSVFAALTRQYADSNMLGYVRTPVSIDISTTGPAAAEYGNWVGRWRRADGIQETTGSYYATWQRTPEGWRLNSEAFVSLACTGSARCPILGERALVVAQRVERLDTLAREPMLVEHPGGALFVAGYNRHSLRLWKSTDHGASWSRVNVGTEAEGAVGNSDVDLAVGPDGTLYFVSLTFDNSVREGRQVVVGVSRDIGATWHWTTVSRTRFDDRPWVKVAPDGMAHIIWNDGHGVSHATSHDGGMTWTQRARVSERGGSSHLAIGPHGELAVRIVPPAASGNQCDTGADFVSVSTDAGGTWRTSAPPGGERPAGCEFDPLTGPRWVDPLAWDATGALFALWGTSTGVWLGRSRDQGANWTSWPLSRDSTVAYYPWLVARNSGELGATWITGADSTMRWHAARLEVPSEGAPHVQLSESMSLESWRGTPPRADVGGEYLAAAWLRDGSLAVVTPIQHESAGRLGFTWWRFVAR